MAYEEINDLGAEKTFALGGVRTDKKTQKRFKNPKEVEGYYLGTKVVQLAGQEKPSKIHIFQGEVRNDKGETVFTGNVGIWGKTDLDRKLENAKIGLMTKAYFDKMQDPAQVKPGKRQMYLFKSFQDQTNSITVEGVSGEEVFETEEEAVEAAADTASEEAFEEEAALDEEEPVADEPVAQPARAPKAAKAPSPDRQAAMQRLMGPKAAKSA